MPLFAEVRRRDDEDAPFALRPALGNNQSGFDGFAETNLIRQKRPFG